MDPMNSIQSIRTIVKLMNDAVMFLNHKVPLFQYINHYLIYTLILVQTYPSNITGRNGAKEKGAVESLKQ